MQDFRMGTFIMVCQYMNYTKAAEALCITQPAVSQQIHLLEEHYGVKLFRYEGKNLILTEEGELLRRSAIRARNDEEHLRERLHGVSRRKRKVRFGATLTIGEFVIPKALAQYIHTEPENDVQMVVGNTHELLEQLELGKIDFAIVEGYFEKEKYESRIFGTGKYVCVRGKNYLFQSQPKQFQDILTEPIVIREEGSGTREILERFLQEKNYSVTDFPKRIETNNMQVIKQLVKESCGITFLYEAAAREELDEGSLVLVQLADFDVSHEFTFIWQKGSIFAAEYERMFQDIKIVSEKG